MHSVRPLQLARAAKTVSGLLRAGPMLTAEVSYVRGGSTSRAMSLSAPIGQRANCTSGIQILKTNATTETHNDSLAKTREIVYTRKCIGAGAQADDNQDDIDVCVVRSELGYADPRLGRLPRCSLRSPPLPSAGAEIRHLVIYARNRTHHQIAAQLVAGGTSCRLKGYRSGQAGRMQPVARLADFNESRE